MNDWEQEDDVEWQPDDDEIPFADPQIQLDYEALLGRFFVQFNKIENAVSDLLRQALHKLERSDLFEEANKGQLFNRLLNLQLIMLALPDHSYVVPYDKVRALANKRNELAHGHFDQNPFDGSYRIVGRKLERGNEWPREKLEDLIRETEGVWQEVYNANLDFWFGHLKDIPDSGSAPSG